MFQENHKLVKDIFNKSGNYANLYSYRQNNEQFKNRPEWWNW